jgi:hypothetical protein
VRAVGKRNTSRRVGAWSCADVINAARAMTKLKRDGKNCNFIQVFALLFVVVIG